MRDLFRKKLEALGHSATGFGSQNFRAGGASAAAKAGVPDCLFKQHGGGSPSRQKIAMWRIQLKTGSLLPET